MLKKLIVGMVLIVFAFALWLFLANYRDIKENLMNDYKSEEIPDVLEIKGEEKTPEIPIDKIDYKGKG